jgi:molecular chaperone DnaK (HSP70)
LIIDDLTAFSVDVIIDDNYSNPVEIIKRNTTIPSKVTFTCQTKDNNQETIRFDVYQRGRNMNELTPIGCFDSALSTQYPIPSLAGQLKFKVELQTNSNSILSVKFLSRQDDFRDDYNENDVVNTITNLPKRDDLEYNLWKYLCFDFKEQEIIKKRLNDLKINDYLTINEKFLNTVCGLIKEIKDKKNIKKIDNEMLKECEVSLAWLDRNPLPNNYQIEIKLDQITDHINSYQEKIKPKKTNLLKSLFTCAPCRSNKQN